MLSAASRLLALALLASSPWCVRAAEGAARSLPSRPGPASEAGRAPLATRKLQGIEYVSTVDVAARLDLRLTWLQRGRKIALTGPSLRAELENDSRDATLNGLRVFLGDPVRDFGGQLYVSRIDFERALTPVFRPGQGVAPLAVPKRIVLDPGHGGRDTGTSTHEKVYALDVARRAKKLLEPAGYQVVLTRDQDVFVEVTERPLIANARRADLFVSIHFNALPNDRKTSGVEVFTFAPKSQHSAAWWSLLRKDDPHLEQTDMPVNRFDHWNVVLAQAVHRRFVVDLKTFDRGRKLAHWGVLRGLSCPGILLECGFLTSDAEARKIATPEYRQQLAEAIAAGIRDYAATVEQSRSRSSAVARGATRRTTHE